MNLIVFEDAGYKNLLPLLYGRATFNLRCGADNLLAKIENAAGRLAEALFVRESLAAVIAQRQTRRVNQPSPSDDQLWINGRLLMRGSIDIPTNSAVWIDDALAAARLDRKSACRLTPAVLTDPATLKDALGGCRPATLPASAGRLIRYPWELIEENHAELLWQLPNLRDEPGGRIDAGAHVANANSVRVCRDAVVRPGAVLDGETGPIHVGPGAVVGPGAIVAGPCFIGERCTILPGASIRGGCSIGDVCKIGGELEATIVHGYTNKQHDGFIGHSYVGEWVNLGAGTVGSDLKNTYGNVRMPINGRPVDTGRQFVGAVIGDHTKTAIGTRLPTGCVIGYACNVALSAFAPQFVPSFTWLTDAGRQPNDVDRAVALARTVWSRRDRTMSPAEEKLFRAIAAAAPRYEKA